MTVYTITPGNPLPPTSGEFEHALHLAPRDTVFLSVGAEVRTSGRSASGIHGFGDITLILDGRVTATGAAAVGVWTQGSVTLGSLGVIFGQFVGLELGIGHSNVLNNAGRIEGGSAGLYLGHSNNHVVNSGTINGDTGIVVDDWVADESLSVPVTHNITNTGTIRGSAYAIMGSGLNRNILKNTGVVDGSVFLGDKNDLYDGRGGTVTGEVYCGEGDDIALGGSGAEAFRMGFGHNIVDGGGGIDTLVFSTSGATVDLRLTTEQRTTNESWDTIRNVENLIGSSWNDNLIGNDVLNVLSGGFGNDTLEGNGGNDTLTGSFGDDVLSGGAGTDMAVFVSRASDYTITVGDDGAVTIRDNRGGTGTGTDRLTGIEFAQFDDRIIDLSASVRSPSGEATNPVPQPPLVAPTPLQAAATPLALKGGRKADVLVGGAGDDLLNGGLGNDRLSGGEGSDVFVFSTKLKKNVDQLTDFSGADDTIQLSKAVFGKLQKGVLSKDAFRIGAKAADADDRIIYNAKTGALSYDADGSGTAHAAVTFAKVKAGTHLTADDFLVI